MRGKKLVAPVTVTALLVMLLLGYLLGVALIPIPPGPKLLLLLAVLALVGVSVFVLWERIQEIRSGEEDDLGQY